MDTLSISPALFSGRREAVMVAAGRVQLALVDDSGLTRYVKVEAKRKNASGQGYERGTVLLEDATHVFVSEKGYGTSRVGTYYPPKPGYATGRFFEDRSASQPHVEAFEAVVEYVNGRDLPAPFVAITAEDKCGLCGQPLRDPVSVDRGIGPECAGKPTGTRILRPVPAAPVAAPDGSPAEADDNAPEAALAAAEGALGYVPEPVPAAPATIAPNRLMLSLDAMNDKALESVIAEAQRLLHKREFARIEAAQESAAALAGMR